MTGKWEFHGSERVMRFIAVQSARDRRRLLQILAEMAEHPMVRPDDVPRTDTAGRTHWLRFRDGFAVMFWFDPAEKELRVIDIGFD